MTTTTQTLVLIGLVIVTAALDLLTTAYALKHRLGKEANPLMKTGWARVILKIAATGLVIVAALRANHAASVVILLMAAVVWGGVSAWNLSVVLKRRRR